MHLGLAVLGPEASASDAIPSPSGPPCRRGTPPYPGWPSGSPGGALGSFHKSPVPHPRAFPAAPGGTVLRFWGPGQPSAQLSCWGLPSASHPVCPCGADANPHRLPALTCRDTGSSEHTGHLGPPRPPPGAGQPLCLPHPTAVEDPHSGEPCFPALPLSQGPSILYALGRSPVASAFSLPSGGGRIQRLQSSAMTQRVHSMGGGPVVTCSRHLCP